MSTCSICDLPFARGVDCHHHNAHYTEDDRGQAIGLCDDCPAVWPLPDVD